MADRNLAFEHKVIGPLKALGGGDWLIAVSGGVDSLTLVEVLFRWRRLLKVRLHVAHIHHGTGVHPRQKRYRDRAQKLVKEWCAQREIPFFSNEPESISLKSEADLREYRHEHLRRWRAQSGAVFTVYAHHRDDLLETRVLRLLRGTGTFGLRGMQLRRAGFLRPLLECSRSEIENYARARKIEFCADPSNKKTDSLRNWLRRTWLPALERKQAGAGAALARSLEILAQDAVVESCSPVVRRAEMKGLSLPEREKFLSSYLRGLGLKNYSRRHVRELIKRIDTHLDTSPKITTFRMLGVVFQVTPDLLVAKQV